MCHLTSTLRQQCIAQNFDNSDFIYLDNDGEYLTIIQGSGNEKYRISSGYIDMRS